MKPASSKWSLLAHVLVLGLLAVAAPLNASAASQSFDVAGNNIQTGMLVSLTPNTGVVEPASNQNVASLVGIVADDEQNFDRQPGQVNVKNDGVAAALVSTLGGDIRVGDRIAPSSIVGIGTKTTTSGWIVGVAQASLDAKTTGAVTSVVTDNRGGKHQVVVASIPVLIKVTYYTAGSAGARPSTASDKLQAAADRLAGKHVSALALVLSFLLLLIGIFLTGTVLYTAIRGGMQAVARQPLSKRVISAKVLQSFGMAIALLVVASLGALLLLRIL
jgi:hypothetical protein